MANLSGSSILGITNDSQKRDVFVQWRKSKFLSQLAPQRFRKRIKRRLSRACERQRELPRQMYLFG
jgi:hypothetical protein